MLLDVLDVVADQTRLDLLANSELQICHSRMRQVFVLRGPLKAMISQDGVTIDNGKRVVVSTGTCAAPTTTAAADVVECAQGTRNDGRWVANSRRLFDPFLEFREYPNGLA